MASEAITPASWVKQGLDLVTSLLNTFNSTNPAINGAMEVSEWLGREGINRYQLTDCLQKAKGRAYPNDGALVYLSDRNDQILRNPLPGLFLKDSGSLATRLAKDPDLCWMVTFAACLFQFHQDENYISNALTRFILETSMKDSDPEISAGRVYIQHTIDKIVPSIWANIVNVKPASEAESLRLPLSLQNVCPRGHELAGDDVGAVASHITSSQKQRIVVESKHFLPDIVLWAIHHFNGLIRVVVSGKTLYDKKQGHGDRELEFKVTEFCTIEGPCTHLRTSGYESLYVFSDLNSDKSASWTYEKPKSDSQAQSPGCRQEFYTIPQGLRVNPVVDDCVRRSAQAMMRWLLDLELAPPKLYQHNLRFHVRLNEREESDSPIQLRVMDVLRKGVPDILHKQWGSARQPEISVSSAASTSFERVRTADPDSWSSTFQEFDDQIADALLQKIASTFPVLEDIADKAGGDCPCHGCRDHRSQNAAPWRKFVFGVHGCLRRRALEAVLLLLAHSIADSFGCEDSSSLNGSNGPIKGVMMILEELSEFKYLNWDTWFATAASVFLGCPFHVRVPMETNGASSLLAVQQGNLAVIAPWLDMTKEANLRRCFGLVPGKGRLGVVSHAKDDFVEFRGVETEFAFIQAGLTQDVRTYIYRFPKETLPCGQMVDIKADTSTDKVKTDIILVASRKAGYQLFTRVRSTQHSRIIDPTEILMHLVQTMPYCECNHDAARRASKHQLLCDTRLYSFDEVLGRWGSIDSSPDSGAYKWAFESEEQDPYDVDRLHATLLLDTHLQLNVAYALSFRDAALLNRAACFTCAQELALRLRLHNGFQDGWPCRDPQYPSRDTDRFIINVAHQMRPHKTEWRQDLAERKLIGGPNGR